MPCPPPVTSSGDKVAGAYPGGYVKYTSPSSQGGVKHEGRTDSPPDSMGNHRSLTAQELGDGFGPGSDLELFIDAADVGVHGFIADAELLRDLLVKKTLAQAIQHFLFALRQVLGGSGGTAGLLK